MAIRIKRSGTASSQPQSTDLQLGELALNYADGKLYYKTAAGAVALLASGSSGGGGSVSFAATTTAGLPATGDAAVLYCTTDNGKLWRWTGTAYAEVGPVAGAATTSRALTFALF